jgi:glycosyltransferase involved in cell wall biosynthesis/peptidoglycan/xylan/chitin deacetylase (PgdA/CDA1 family)
MIELTIIVPTYNRPVRLRLCLEALAGQTQPVQDFEVIIVNDGGTDDVEKMILGLNVPYPIKLVNQENQGQNVARNYGVRFAQGRYILFLDDDIIPEPELVAEHLQLHRQLQGVVGLGQMTLDFGKTKNWFIANYLRGWQRHYEELNRGAREPMWHDCYAGNVSLSKSAFLKVGGFDTSLRRSHDVELGYRLQQHGFRYIYLAKAIGRQDERKAIRELLKDAEKAGAAWLTLCQLHPNMYPHLLGSMIPGVREALVLNILWRARISPDILARVGVIFGNTKLGRKWFHFINQYCRWRGYRQAVSAHISAEGLIQGIPILMYHAFGRIGEPASRFVLPIHRFTQQMSLLKLFRFHVLSLEEFQHYQLNQSLPPARSVMLTFDDGYAELHDLVYPVLERHGFPATVFLVSGKIGTRNDWTALRELYGRPLLTWDQVRKMGQDGIQFGAHSRTHVPLSAISPGQMQEEIGRAKADLETELHIPVTAFAYPYSEFNGEIQEAVCHAGFRAGYSANSGLNMLGSPPFALHRIEIEGTISLVRFVLALWFGSTR